LVAVNWQENFLSVLVSPSPANLWQLRGDLLQAGWPPDAPVWETIDHFYVFLNELSASMNAHEYSKLATMLDIGAVGGVAIQSLIESKLSAAELWQRLLVGGISEGLMVLASRQYVKGARAEMIGVFQAACWELFGHLWHLAAQLQPKLAPVERRRMLDELLAPIYEEEVDDGVKIVLIGRLFQTLLLIHLSHGQE
jgi:hypothetical protein